MSAEPAPKLVPVFGEGMVSEAEAAQGVRGKIVPAPRSRHEVREEQAVKGNGGGISDGKFRESTRWGVLGILALAALVAVWKWGPPSVSVDSPDRWTGTDQIRFETANNSRIEKLERIIERMDALLLAQAKTTDRLIGLMEKVDERVKALELWRDGNRTK